MKVEPTEDVVSIKQIINEIDELYYDFENSDGNLTTFIIDGEILHTDVGYAIVGIEFYKNILKKRIGKTYNSPTEDVAPIVRGKWIYKDFNWYCSNCNQRVSTPGYVGTVEFMKKHFKICNHCGAKMDGKESEEEG